MSPRVNSWLGEMICSVLIRSLSTKVPLREPRSLTHSCPSRSNNSVWDRLTRAWGMVRSASLPRPMVVGNLSRTSLVFDLPPTMISFALSMSIPSYLKTGIHLFGCSRGFNKLASGKTDLIGWAACLLAACFIRRQEILVGLRLGDLVFLAKTCKVV